MSLANLTTSGWVWFALTMLVDLKLVSEFAFVMRHRPVKPVELDILAPVLMTAWLLWLVTP